MDRKTINWHDYLTYNPENGELIWRPREASMFKEKCKGVNPHASWNARFANKVAGKKAGLNKMGLKNSPMVCVHYIEVQTSYIVWMMHGNPWPPEGLEIDHKDGDRWNNRIENLRLATRSQNEGNKGGYRNSKIGQKGVYLDRRRQKYMAEIMVNRVRKRLGAYLTIEEAANAYAKAAIELRGEFAKF